MSISNEIQKLQTNLTNSYSACSDKGATIPASQNFDNLADCINSIPTGSTLKYIVGVEEEINKVVPTIYTVTKNYVAVGSLTDNLGKLSNFSTSNYATSTGLTIPSDNFEIDVNFTTPTRFRHDNPLISDNSNIGDVFIQSSTGKISSWNGSGTAVNGVTSMTTSTNYSFKLVANGIVSMYLKEGLPSDDINDYTLEYSNFALYLNNCSLLFGVYLPSQYLTDGGSINMSYTRVKSNGSIIWQGITKGE